MTEHHIVGRPFRGYDGVVYRCARWERHAGFWMRVVQGRRGDGRTETCISERAIGATFHPVRGDESYEAHDPRCECFVCEGRPSWERAKGPGT